MTIKDIETFYQDNREYYNKLKTSISSNIEGRIPHHKVVVLNVLVNLTNISKYLEVGVHNGASMSYVVNQNLCKIDCFGLDLFQSAKLMKNCDSLKYIIDDISKEKSYRNIQNNNSSKSHITLIECNSQDPRIAESLRSLESDLLFIDGDHSYTGIKNDFNNYAPTVKSGGFVIFDDYEPKYKEIMTFCNKEINEKEFRKIGVFMNNELILQKI